jgi:hypothetical protein
MARFRLTFPTIPTATLGPQRGHIGATNDQIAADNTGHQWSSILTAQQLTSAGIPGRRITPVLSRTEHVTFASLCVVVRMTTPRRKRIVEADRMRRPREQTMSSLRDKLHWVRCKLHVHRWRPEKDYQGKWYRECRDCGTISGMARFPLGAG